MRAGRSLQPYLFISLIHKPFCPLAHDTLLFFGTYQIASIHYSVQYTRLYTQGRRQVLQCRCSRTWVRTQVPKYPAVPKLGCPGPPVSPVSAISDLHQTRTVQNTPSLTKGPPTLAASITTTF